MRLIKTLGSELRAKTLQHPCFNGRAAHTHARLHLPVAPACNIQCRYCLRSFDCLNESRPGVASSILTPDEAIERFLAVRAKIPSLSVVGLAGPGEALANWPQTEETLRRVAEIDPSLTLCLSTNGLELIDRVEGLLKIGVRHLTVTINAVDPAIGERIYKWVDLGGRRLHGLEAAETLLARQLEGLRALRDEDVIIKVNTVMIKGVNDHHVPEVARLAKSMRAYVGNIMPLLPVKGSDFGHLEPTDHLDLARMRALCSPHLTQMTHCRQCRADAVGLLAHDRLCEFRKGAGGAADDAAIDAAHGAAAEGADCAAEAIAPGAIAPGALAPGALASGALGPGAIEPGAHDPGTIDPGALVRLAVTSTGGLLVDAHFGQCEAFLIYEGDGRSFRFLERRPLAARFCHGPADCGGDGLSAVEALSDCRAVVTRRAGPGARDGLRAIEVLVVEDHGLVEEALRRAWEILAKMETGAASGDLEAGGGLRGCI